MGDAFFGGLKSLTPQRKHHKLLKDGSEVWSEDVEKIFVQGASRSRLRPSPRPRLFLNLRLN